jgi:hypothetical protein
MPELEELRKQPHMSVHSLKTFLDCPRKWRLKYIDRVQPAFRPVALAIGSAIHEGVGHALIGYAKHGTLDRESARGACHGALFRELHGDGPPVLFDDDETEENLRDSTSRMLDAVLDDLPRPQEVLGVEVGFQIELHDPDTGEALPVPLIGSVDALVIEAGETICLELKTAKRRWTEDQITFDLQLTAYRRALRQLGHPGVRPRLVVVTKSKTPVVQTAMPHRGPQHERDLEATAASVTRAVRAGVDHPVRGWACKTCAFAGACK